MATWGLRGMGRALKRGRKISSFRARIKSQIIKIAHLPPRPHAGSPHHPVALGPAPASTADRSPSYPPDVPDLGRDGLGQGGWPREALNHATQPHTDTARTLTDPCRIGTLVVLLSGSERFNQRFPRLSQGPAATDRDFPCATSTPTNRHLHPSKLSPPPQQAVTSTPTSCHLHLNKLPRPPQQAATSSSTSCHLHLNKLPPPPQQAAISSSTSCHLNIVPRPLTSSIQHPASSHHVQKQHPRSSPVVLNQQICGP